MYVYKSINSVTVQRSEQIHFRCHSLPGTRGPKCKEDDVIWTEGISREFSVVLHEPYLAGLQPGQTNTSACVLCSLSRVTAHS